MRIGKINEKILKVVYSRLPFTSLPWDSGVFIIDRSNPDAEALMEYITTFPFVVHVSTKADNEMKAAKAEAKAAKEAKEAEATKATTPAKAAIPAKVASSTKAASSTKIAIAPVGDDDDGWDEDAPYTQERLEKELALSFRQMREGKLRPIDELIRELKEMAANDRKRKHNATV
jgi:hypothetical protein